MTVFKLDYLTFSNALAEYLQVTSIHGLHRIGWAKNTIWKVIWTVLFLIAFGLFVFILVLLTQEYQARPIKTVIKRSNDYESFAGVTICNLNPMRTDKVSQSVLDQYQKFTSLVNWSMAIEEGYPDPYLRERTTFAMVLANNGWDARTTLGHQLHDLIVHCAFDGRECNLDRDFVQFWNDLYGNCFTFNGGNLKSNYSKKVQTTAGPINGLVLVLNIQSKLYLRTLTEAVGVRVLIHPSTVMPFPDFDGITLPGNFEGSVGIDVNEYRHMSKPYGSCSSEVEDRYHYSYSTLACHNVCKQDATLISCGCLDPTLPLYEGMKICDINTIAGEERECHQAVVEAFAEGRESCDCPVPCVDTQYGIDYSMAKWPNNAFADQILNKTLFFAKDSDGNENKSYPLSDLVAVKVFFKEIGKTIYQEEAIYTLAHYLTFVGGISALMIGASIISIFEILELLYTWATLSCLHYPKWENRKKRYEKNLHLAQQPGRLVEKEPPPKIEDDETINEKILPRMHQAYDNRKVVASH
uniref:Uncharacterized protein n=1 Tax=Plectus sambesii TaxID=2011161 RepID=A0A914UN08_9BILA